MSVDVRPVKDEGKWNRYVDRSPEATVFHRREALEVLRDHSGADLTLLAGFVGQEPVGVFPVFEYSLGPVRAAFSPPPDLRIPYLGPVTLNMDKLKPRKEERRRRRFVEGCLSWVQDRYSPRYRHVRTTPGVSDVRPFKWNDWNVTPTYTYEVDLETDQEELLMAFSSDARSNVRSTPEPVDIEVGGVDAARRIVEQVRDRYAEQGIRYELGPGFVGDLDAALPESALLPYVCRVDGEFAGGILALADSNRVYRWQGGVRGGRTDYPVNDLLDWRVARDGIDAGRCGYDLVGAENRRINDYKSKFAPTLRTYYSLDRGTALTNAVAGLYGRLR